MTASSRRGSMLASLRFCTTGGAVSMTRRGVGLTPKKRIRVASENEKERNRIHETS